MAPLRGEEVVPEALLKDTALIFTVPPHSPFNRAAAAPATRFPPLHHVKHRVTLERVRARTSVGAAPRFAELPRSQ